MIRSCWDLGTIVFVSGIIVILALNGLTTTFPFMMLPLLLVLFVPGYALAAAIFPGREIGIAERLMIILAGSLAIAALGGLALHWLPVLLSTVSWAILLACVSIMLSFIALLRRFNLEESSEDGLQEKYHLSAGQYSLLFLAFLIVIAAMVFSHRGAQEQASSEFTQLWLLPVEGATNGAVEVGVANYFSTPEDYELHLYADGELFQSFTIELEPDDEWVMLISPPANANNRIEAILDHEESLGTVHRRVAIELEDGRQ